MLIYLIETWGMWWRCCGEDLLLFHLTNGFFGVFLFKRRGSAQRRGFNRLDLHSNRSSQYQ